MKYTIHIGRASRVCRGEKVCGDNLFVFSDEKMTLCVVADGSGHGPEAGRASGIVCDYVREHPNDSLADMMKGCHRAARGTRGAAVTICRAFHESGVLEHVGVGNVDVNGRTYARIRPVSTPGIVGTSVRKIGVAQYNLEPGDLLVVYTDGISGRFNVSQYLPLDVQGIADGILEAHAKDHDDATCVVLAYGNHRAHLP